MRDIREEPGLAILGPGRTQYPSDYDPAVLVAFANRHPGRDCWVTLRCPEFTTLCPITRQPDFGDLTVSYIPDALMVESKSLKLYLFSFRNHGDFHEDVVNIILDDLAALLHPRYMEVQGEFRPRGGISIEPWACHHNGEPAYRALADERRLRHRLRGGR